MRSRSLPCYGMHVMVMEMTVDTEQTHIEPSPLDLGIYIGT